MDRNSVERSLAARLVAAAKLDETALDRLVRLQATNDERLESLLVKLGLASERDVAEAFAAVLGLAVAESGDYPATPVCDGKFNRKYLRGAGVLPIAEAPDELVLAMVDPLDAEVMRAMEMAAGRRVVARVALASQLEAAYARLYDPDPAPAGEVAASLEEPGSDDDLLEDVDRLRDLASEGPVIRLVNHLITRAVESRASDIHVEPYQNRLVIRYRIDGLLSEAAVPPTRLRAALISRIKIMAKLNIAERRLPQDGRMRLALQGKEFDLRVSTMPTLHGESVVMRILDRTSLVCELPLLGFETGTLTQFERILERPQGILLVTGPTGSGKTTTLYACLHRLNAPERKLFTVEDPIEYQLEGVNQIQVKPQIGLTFGHVLRSILRQDPDIIMVGEMRDLETAEIAVQAALTGHLVLSTLHTNSAAGAVTRLLDMGVADYLVTSTVTGVLAQRLVRQLCPQCREPYRALPELMTQLRLAAVAGDPPTLYRARGCARCQGSGYFGRIAIMEVLEVSDRVRRLILNRAAMQDIQAAACEEGMRTMYEDGLLKAMAGTTSIEEVLRVTRDV
ncbi:MAG TPA: type II secretion system ATPase GspE [Stellaceae bacterium]|nr:type II secretion system ATPase GspE [Stellaceae bacterium]